MNFFIDLKWSVFRKGKTALVQSITNIRIHSNIRIILNEYIHIRKYSDSNKMLNIFGHSFDGSKLPRIYPGIHSVKK